MRIFFPNTAPLIKYGIGQAFADLGHEVLFCNILWEADWQQKLENFRPDCVFTDGGWGIFGHLFPYLHNRRIPHIYWAIEDPPFFDILSLDYAKNSLYVFTTCRETIERYRQHGIRAHLLPFGFHPRYYHQDLPDPRFPYDAVFIGNNYDFSVERLQGYRIILEPLMQAGYNIKIFGNEWWLDQSRPFYIDPSFYGGYMPSEDLGRVCASVPMVIGIHSVLSSSTMLSMRTFEVLGCGGFHLTQYTPAVQNYFSNHQDLVWTKSSKETLDLMQYYLSRPEKRQKIARQGQFKVFLKHTYRHRVELILELMRRRSRAKTA
ncbi:MAG: glycosyltransferase [Syntrophomonas sp.]